MRGFGEHVRRHAVGYLALFVALGGTAWAGSQIGASDIKDNAIRSHHVKGDTLVGSDIDESKLKVVRAFDADLSPAAFDEPVFHVGQLTVTASCEFGISLSTQMTVRATSSGSGKQETTYETRNGTDETVPVTNRNGIDDEPKTILTGFADVGDAQHGGGTLVYHSSNEVVTATFRFLVDDGCEIAGTVTRADL